MIQKGNTTKDSDFYELRKQILQGEGKSVTVLWRLRSEVYTIKQNVD